MSKILDHAPSPGPVVVWRRLCFQCGNPVAEHGCWWERALYRRRRSRKAKPV